MAVVKGVPVLLQYEIINKIRIPITVTVVNGHGKLCTQPFLASERFLYIPKKTNYNKNIIVYLAFLLVLKVLVFLFPSVLVRLLYLTHPLDQAGLADRVFQVSP